MEAEGNKKNCQGFLSSAIQKPGKSIIEQREIYPDYQGNNTLKNQVHGTG